MSTIIKRVAALAFASAVIAGVLPAGALAQQATTPPSVSMLTQISGLTVNSVEGIAHVLGGSDAVPVMYSGVEAVVTATRPWSCPPVNGQPVACAAVMPEPTPIHVMTRTSVLDRNRKAIAWSDIQVGDTVNVYGRLNQATGIMEAEILRDTTRPEVSSPVQLEMLQVMQYTETKTGYEMIASRGAGPCYQFTASSRLSFPCPEGTMPADNVRSSLGMTEKSRVYTISVPASASVMDVNRKPIKAGSIQAGDTVNVYGMLTSRSAGTVNAQIVRVLSSRPIVSGPLALTVTSADVLEAGAPGQVSFKATGGTGTYQWEISDMPVLGGPKGAVRAMPQGMSLVTAGVINCLVAPCPQPDTSSAQISGTPSVPGTYLVVVKVTDSAGRTAVKPVTLEIGKGNVDMDEDLSVTVETDKDAYRLGEKMKVTVALHNDSRRSKVVEFGGCEASYDVLPGFSLQSLMLCTAELKMVKIRAGGEKEWTFEHDFASGALPRIAFPMQLEVVGRAHTQGVGTASKTITLNATR